MPQEAASAEPGHFPDLTPPRPRPGLHRGKGRHIVQAVGTLGSHTPRSSAHTTDRLSQPMTAPQRDFPGRRMQKVEPRVILTKGSTGPLGAHPPTGAASQNPVW